MTRAPLIHVSLALAATLLCAGVAEAARCPNVLLVLDRSGSMNDKPEGSADTKWTILRTAVETLLDRWGDTLPIGVELYADESIGHPTDQACYLQTRVAVEPAHDTAMAIKMLLANTGPNGGTNTGDAIRRAAQVQSLRDPRRGQFMVLITDGDPTCNSTEPSYTYSQLATAATLVPPIVTFVVGFDGTQGVSPDKLNRMAQSGGAPRAACQGTPGSPCYYSANDLSGLDAALDEIIRTVAGGEFGTTTCDDSCFLNGCDPGFVCVVDEQSIAPRCDPDPCADVVCADDEFCRAAACYAVCPACQAGRICQDGECVEDKCRAADGGSCPENTRCVAATGGCTPDLCAGKSCTPPAICNPSTGSCTVDPCRVITCPAGTTCREGASCERLPPSESGGDGGSVGPPSSGRSGAGCSIAASSRGASGALMALVLLAAAIVIARSPRQRRP